MSACTAVVVSGSGSQTDISCAVDSEMLVAYSLNDGIKLCKDPWGNFRVVEVS